MVDTLRIEKDIPIASPPTKYGILDQVEPGDSVLFTNMNFSSLAACMQYRQKRYGKRFVRRTVEGGVRVWRTA
jgi:selenocysteine lyase/cysteine desulfurase